MIKPTPEEARALLAYRKKYEKYRYYTPNGKLEKFIEMVGNNKHFINLLIAGNGVGKTAGMTNILANILFEPKNKWFNYPLFNEFPYIKKGRIISDPTTITEAIIPEFKKWFPLSQYETSKEKKSYDYRWKTTTGFEFDVMSTEQDVKEFESANLGFAFIDEPCPESIFKATISRMRRGGIIIVGFTPLKGSAYFYDEYVTHPHTEHYA